MAILVLAGGSATAFGYADYAAARLAGHGPRVVSVRDVSTRALLRGDLAHPSVAELLRLRPAALVAVTAVRRSSTSGLLRSLVELLAVEAPALPVAVGGFAAHARVLDHALRPALGPDPLPTLFLPERDADLGLLDTALDALVARTDPDRTSAASAIAGR